MSIMTGLSGNEMYCLHLKGLSPGELVIGNSVYSLGFVGGIGAGLQGAFGGEVTQITQIIHEGRPAVLRPHGPRGPAARRRRASRGVTSDLRQFHGNIEFLSVASCVHADGRARVATGSFPPAATARSSTANSTPATCRSSSSSATWPIPSASAAGCWAA